MQNTNTNTTNNAALVAFYTELNDRYIELFYSTAVEPTIKNISSYVTHCAMKNNVTLTMEQYNDAIVYFTNSIEHGMEAVALTDATLIAALNKLNAVAVKA